ncbi:MAG: 50S ribosomal protein L25 [Calditrichaeota bacterium]|nr:MAG: 50S ribosomal protein L25 [Calditrichota bacterium]
MAEIIEAKRREQFGSRFARRFRRQGLIPAVFYFRGDDALSLLLDSKQITQFLGHTHGLIDLQIEGEKSPRKCVVKDVQYDPLTDQVVHVDFLGITMGEKIEVTVQLKLIGTPVGVKQGGILEHLTRELEIECFPRHLPDHLEVDVSELNVGDSIQVKDLNFENITILNDPNETIALVELPKAAISAEEEAAAEEAAAEAAAEGEEEAPEESEE